MPHIKRPSRRYVSIALATTLATIALSLTVPAASAQPACLATYAFTNLAPGGSSIALRTNCGNAVRQLTSNGPGSTAADDSPSLSPDGQTVAFRHNVPGTRSEIYVVSASGGPARQVTSLGGLASAPSWSPDSKQLVFAEQTDEEATSSIFRINSDGSGATALTSDIYAAHPAWCHNGQIAFGVQAIGQSSIYRMSSIDGSGMTSITSGGFDSYPAWSPDCQYVFFQRSIANTGNIYTIPVAGGQSSQLTFGNNEAYPSVSADWTLGYTHITTIGTQIYTQWLGGTQAVAQPLTSVEDMEPSFQPGDGSVPSPPGFLPDLQPSYVALGDSFSAGEGAPGPAGYEQGTDVPNLNKCHRSDRSYSNIDAHVTGMPPEYKFHACSGALVQDFFKPFPQNHIDSATGQPQNPTETHAQLDWIDAKTRVITLTIGGNNALFPEVMDYCSGRAFYQASCESEFGKAVDTAIAKLAAASGTGASDNLPDLYKIIHQKAPNAQVFVLGYPRFFPKGQNRNCLTGVLNRTFLVSDMRWINEEAKKMDDVIKKAAKAQRFTYVDLYDSFNGHELCTSQPYLNSARPLDKQESYHPNVAGQARFANLLRPSLP
jgi:lysophospholipase L1-like esterase